MYELVPLKVVYGTSEDPYVTARPLVMRPRDVEILGYQLYQD
jgi:hypothetical protein